MKSIKVHIGGLEFPIRVQEDEIDNVMAMADYVNKKVSISRAELNTKQDTYILMHACLSIAEELFELRNSSPDEQEVVENTMGKVNQKLNELLEKWDG